MLIFTMFLLCVRIVLNYHLVKMTNNLWSTIEAFYI